MIHIFTHPVGGRFLSEINSRVNSPSIPHISFRLFNSCCLAQGNLKWRLCLLSLILGTTSQGLITLSFFCFFYKVVLLSAFFAFYTQDSLVQVQRLRASGKLLTDSRTALPSVSRWAICFSKISYNLDFASFLYLREFNTRVSLDVALSQSLFASL